MRIGIPTETFPNERRVAVIPAAVPGLIKAGFAVIVEAGAGAEAGHPDSAYLAAGATVEGSRNALFAAADFILQVRALGANPDAGRADLERFHKGQIVTGFAEPMTALDEARMMAERGVTLFAMELVPRTTRAQAMDALSSMQTIAGYRAVILAADAIPKMFPMMMTAAGTISPTKVLVLGAGVAGLQAIATARRLGAVVSAYDVRPAVKEQCQSLGAKFVELDLDTAGAEGKGGYATELGDDQLRRQRQQLAKVIADHDVIITTAAVPGRKAPILITAEMMAGMSAGSVIVDLAAERGGNCELTKTDQTVVVNGVRVIGPGNVASEIPHHASQMYSKNITTFLHLLAPRGALELNRNDDVIASMLVCHDGEVIHPLILAAMGTAGGSK